MRTQEGPQDIRRPLPQQQTRASPGRRHTAGKGGHAERMAALSRSCPLTPRGGRARHIRRAASSARAERSHSSACMVSWTHRGLPLMRSLA